MAYVPTAFESLVPRWKSSTVSNHPTGLSDDKDLFAQKGINTRIDKYPLLAKSALRRGWAARRTSSPLLLLFA